MKKLILILTLPFSILVFSSPSCAEWTEVGENVIGSIYYVDFERIRKRGGFVYYWDLGDHLTPKGDFKNLSVVNYNQVDCELMRRKNLTQTQYKGKMGTGQMRTNNIPDENWTYPQPGSVLEIILNKVCSR